MVEQRAPHSPVVEERAKRASRNHKRSSNGGRALAPAFESSQSLHSTAWLRPSSAYAEPQPGGWSEHPPRWLRSERQRASRNHKEILELGGCCSLWSPYVPLRRFAAHRRFTRPLWLLSMTWVVFRCPHSVLPLDSNICSRKNSAMAALLDLHPDTGHPVSLGGGGAARGARPTARRRPLASSRAQRRRGRRGRPRDPTARVLQAEAGRGRRQGRCCEGRRVHRHRRLAREDHHRVPVGRGPPGRTRRRARAPGTTPPPKPSTPGWSHPGTPR